jgi:DNA uptake protein ComE-like DNA-binding protein
MRASVTPLAALSAVLLLGPALDCVALLRQPAAAQALSRPPPLLRPDVNRDPERLLRLLPRIGPARARAIVAHRERDGPFAGLDELRSVHGIGPVTVNDLRPWAKAGFGAPGLRGGAR